MFGPCNSAYAVNLTYGGHTADIILKIQPFRVEYIGIIEPKVGMFSEAEGRGKYSLRRVQYMPIFHKEGF